MKVCYILKSFPRLSQTFILHELLELERQGVELLIIARKGDSPLVAGEAFQELQAPVHYLPADQLQSAADWIAPLVRAHQVAHIHAHFATWAARTAMAVSAATGIPYSFTAHAHDMFHADVEADMLAETIEHARFMVTVSEYNKAYLDHLLSATGRIGRVIRLYNGIDLQRFTASSAVRDPNLIVSVGRLIAKKGFSYLIEAVRLLVTQGQQIRCVIVGEGEERAVLEQQIADASLQDQICLMGAQPHTMVRQLVSQAALFALPCVIDADGDRDALPTVLLEAMALGTPVISTTISGIPEIIQHQQHGLLVAERDSVALAQALYLLLDSPVLRDQFSHAASCHVRHAFNLATNVGRLKQLFYAGE